MIDGVVDRQNVRGIFDGNEAAALVALFLRFDGGIVEGKALT